MGGVVRFQLPTQIINNKNMTKELHDWLEKEFYFNNHKKYHKYFKEWIDNLTNDQIKGFQDLMIGVITKSKIQH